MKHSSRAKNEMSLLSGQVWAVSNIRARFNLEALVQSHIFCMDVHANDAAIADNIELADLYIVQLAVYI